MAEGGDLLCAPTAEDEEFQKAHTRSSCSYENRCARFRLRERHYATQYAHIYFTRLELMRPHVEAAAVKKWGMETRRTVLEIIRSIPIFFCKHTHLLAGEEVSVKTSLMEVKVEEKCCIVGTLFKKMELQPSILKEISAKVSESHFPLSLPPLPLSSFPPLLLPPLLLSPSPSSPSSPPLPPLLPRNKSVTKSAHFLHLQHHLLPQPPRAKCVSSSDALVVEDSSQRIDLSRDIPAQELVTGEQCTRRD